MAIFKAEGADQMSKAKIPNPKVFISYAWGTEEYQTRVLSFAASLIDHGVDVLLDKWSLVEGNDTFAFMEKCVTDQSVTNVLMLLDPLYAQKSDAHEGGVGAETQIISAKVYQEVEQSKFIPVVFERDADKKVCKPTYLQGRLHFDLSLPETYEAEYQRLVKRLYGKEIYEKPEIGSPPKWLDEPVNRAYAAPAKYDSLKANNESRVKEGQFAEYFVEIEDKILAHQGKGESNDIIRQYAEMQLLRDEYLLLLRNYVYIENSHEFIATFFEETRNDLERHDDTASGLKRLLVYEMFICTIAVLLKGKDYATAGKLLNWTYFQSVGSMVQPRDYTMFRSSEPQFDDAVRKRDGKNYYSGIAQYWTSNVNMAVMSKEDFVFADLICYNVSVFKKPLPDMWYWFPLTYIYEREFKRSLQPFAKKMMSKNWLIRVLPLFGYNSIEQFKEVFETVCDRRKNGEFSEYRYEMAFDSAPLLCSFIQPNEFGTLK